MTEKTPLLEIEYPEEYDDPYWVDIKAMYDKMDQWIQANLEDQSLIVHTDGDVTLDGDTLAWSSNFLLRSSRSGKTLTVLASNVTLPDGEIFYVVAPVRPIVDDTVSIQAGNPTLPTNNIIPIGMRVGTRIYFFNLDGKPYNKTFTSGSIAGGADWDVHVETKMYFTSGDVLLVHLQKTAGVETSHDIRIYDGDPAGAGVIRYQATAINLHAAAHYDPNIWLFELPTPGDFYFKATNNGGGAVEYSLRLLIRKN